MKLPLDLHVTANLEAVCAVCAPVLAIALPVIVHRREGKPVIATSIVRSLGWQAELLVAWLRGEGARYGIVRKPAPAGLSKHNPDADGLAHAIDLDGDPSSPGRVLTPLQQDLIDICAEIGLTCGVNFKDPDPVHFEDPEWDRGMEEAYMGHMQRLDRQMGNMP